jgi:NADPH2:quinone reductase
MIANAVVRVHQHGGPECLSLDDIPLQTVGPDELLIEVQAAGVNFYDTQLRSGLYKQPLPLALGNEGAGIIRELGAEVTGFELGSSVGWVQSTASYARWKLIAAEQAFALPDSISCTAAAATLFQGMTAHYLACSTYPLERGSTCVVHSAAGGVGSLLTQIAKHRGATVIAAVSTQTKAEVAASNGADAVVIYGQSDLLELAKHLTGGRGVDVVYDAVGKDTFEQSLACLRPRGLLALYGEASGLVPPLDVRQLLTAGSVYLTRTGLGAYAATPEERRQRGAEVLSWLARSVLKPRIDRTFALEDAAEAHRAIESRGTVGKILLLPTSTRVSERTGAAAGNLMHGGGGHQFE